jgi:SOS response regulatory protein OraA/RecX
MREKCQNKVKQFQNIQSFPKKVLKNVQKGVEKEYTGKMFQNSKSKMCQNYVKNVVKKLLKKCFFKFKKKVKKSLPFLTAI